MSLHIGVDFDNTIVDYGEAFYHAARERGQIPADLPRSKTDVRNYFRAQKKEPQWTELQGYVYGARMDLARPYPGIELFFKYCKANEVQISIISHKTKHPFLGTPYDLHASAFGWLQAQSFFYPHISTYFELTLKNKLERIALSGCRLFIDDLPELLQEPSFPQHVQKILFDPHNDHPQANQWQILRSWTEMPSILSALSAY